MRTRLLSTLVTVALAACGDGGGNGGGTVIPMDMTPVQNGICLGWSHGVRFDLVCPETAGGPNRVCEFDIYTSDSSILTIQDGYREVGANSEASTGWLGTLGKVPGTVDILVRDRDSNIVTSPGRVTVVNLSCV
jgi:hypothetical protein